MTNFLENLLRLRLLFNLPQQGSELLISDDKINEFQSANDLILPYDIIEYFRIVNGSKNYDKNFFYFNSFDEFQSIIEKYKDWNGIPNYKNIANTLEDSKNCYVFADYNCNLFCYAIKLNARASEKNEVYGICGDEFKILSESFTDFINKYLENPDLLSI